MVTVGFPRMHKEAGERRDYLPALVGAVASHAHAVIVEAGIGSGMGLNDLDYEAAGPRIRIGTNEEAFAQDIVIALRCPETAEFSKLRGGSTLVAMLHFPTRPARIEALLERGIEAVSLDALVDEAGRRLVVNAHDVAWNGLEAAFEVLESTWPPLRSRERRPVSVLVTGTGAIGRHAVDAATKFGDSARRDAFQKDGIPGAVVRAVGRNVTGDEDLMRELLAETDVLVDASQRPDPSRPLIPNEWIAYLPAHAVICDLVVDPYLLDTVPPTVRSIEGIPFGNLDRYVFAPDAPDWMDTIPPAIPTEHRRITVSCYSWPGVHPRACMELYGAQMTPLLDVLLERGGAAGLQAEGGYHERALHGAWLRPWLERGSNTHGGRGPLGALEPS